MAGIITTCPSCAQQNEVDTATVPPGTKHASCWFCASRIPLIPSGTAPKEAVSPFGEKYDTGKALTGKAKAAARAGGKGGGLGTVIVLMIAVLLVAGLVVGAIAVLSSLGGMLGGESTGGQFRAIYHDGSGPASGEKAWQTRLAAEGGFSLARHEGMLFAVANVPRSQSADEYDPPGVPEDVVPRIRALHGKALSEGFRPLGRPEKTALQHEQHDRFHIKMRSGLCYRVGAYASGDAQDVDLLMYQPDSFSLVVADTRGERDGYVEHCPAKNGDYQFEIRMSRGGGLVVHAAYVESEEPAHDTGHVYAVNATNGSTEWDVELAREVTSSPAYVDGMIAVGTTTANRSKAAGRMLRAGSLLVLNAGDGTEQCIFEAGGPVHSSPLVHEGVAYFGTCGLPSDPSRPLCEPASEVHSKVHAVRVEDCSEVWSYNAAHPVVTAPATDGSQLFFSAGPRIHAMDLETGAPTWSTDIPGTAGGPVVSGDLLVFGTDRGVLYGLRPRAGDQLWSFESDNPIVSTPAITDAAVFAAGADGTLFAIDADDGTRIWDVRASAGIEGPIAAVGEAVYVLAGTHVASFGVEDGGSRFDSEVGRGFTSGCSPVIARSMLFVADGDGSLIALR